jgi:hypothetical protein
MTSISCAAIAITCIFMSAQTSRWQSIALFCLAVGATIGAAQP